jgi:hypothetical protein
MGVAKGSRCWKWNQGCRAQAPNVLKRGEHVYRYCDDVDHDPRTVRDHMHAIDAWVTEAALDLGMTEDIVWHDIAIAYIESEVHDASMKADVAQGLGIPKDVLR